MTPKKIEQLVATPMLRWVKRDGQLVLQQLNESWVGRNGEGNIVKYTQVWRDVPVVEE